MPMDLRVQLWKRLCCGVCGTAGDEPRKADETKGLVETVFHTLLEFITPRYPMINRSQRLKEDLPGQDSEHVKNGTMLFETPAPV